MKIKYMHIVFLLGLMLLAGCTHEDFLEESQIPQNGNGPQAEKITVGVNMSTLKSRVVFEDDVNFHFKWEAGDQLKLVGLGWDGKLKETVLYIDESTINESLVTFTGFYFSDDVQCFYVYYSREGHQLQFKVEDYTLFSYINYSTQVQDCNKPLDHLRNYFVLTNNTKYESLDSFLAENITLTMQNAVMDFNFSTLSDKVKWASSLTLDWTINNDSPEIRRMMRMEIINFPENTSSLETYMCFDPSCKLYQDAKFYVELKNTIVKPGDGNYGTSWNKTSTKGVDYQPGGIYYAPF